MDSSCCKDGCNLRFKLCQPRSHNPDADTIEVHYCRNGHCFSVCPSFTCCHLRAKYQRWVEDPHKVGQWILKCESCYFDNSVVKVCKTCFEKAGEKTGLQKLCESCLLKNSGINASDACTTAPNERCVFRRSQRSKSFEQCTVISVNDKCVKVQLLSDSKVVRKFACGCA